MNDTELEKLLDHALAPEPAAPSADALVTLHRAIDRQRVAATRRRPRRMLVALGSAVAVLTATGGAFAVSGAVLPEPLRVVAHAVGLPIDSPELARARAARHALRESLQHGDAASTAAASTRLKSALAQLSQGDLGELRDATALLSQAEELTPTTTAEPDAHQSERTTTATGPTKTDPTTIPTTSNGTESEPSSEALSTTAEATSTTTTESSETTASP